ncbi:MAG: hypothetical protein Fur0032_01330 [Terrimicrobiaceae bacterium]
MEPAGRATLAIAVMAAFADGAKHESERGEIQRLAAEWEGGRGELSAITRQVLRGGITRESALAELRESADRMLAFEVAVSVCEADGVTSPREKEFLAELAEALGLEAGSARETVSMADALAGADSGGVDLPPAAIEQPAGAVVPATGQAAPSQADPRAQEAAGVALRFAILNGALELLPQQLSTVAILPLKMKMVYGIGKLYGYRLDAGHVKEFLAAAGVGLTSQFLEGFARKLAGGLMGGAGKALLGKKGGRMAKGVAGQASGSAFTFATTYALGRLAQLYYAGGRQLGSAELKSSFDRLTSEARSLHASYLPAIQEQAQGLNPAKIMEMVTSRA